MDVLIKIGAVVILIAGAVYPLIAIYRLMARMNQKERGLPSPAQVMVRLFLIATVPLAGILGGFAGLSPTVWQSSVLRVIIIAAALASVVGFVILALLTRQEKETVVVTPPAEEDE